MGKLFANETWTNNAHRILLRDSEDMVQVSDYVFGNSTFDRSVFVLVFWAESNVEFHFTGAVRNVKQMMAQAGVPDVRVETATLGERLNDEVFTETDLDVYD